MSSIMTTASSTQTLADVDLEKGGVESGAGSPSQSPRDPNDAIGRGSLDPAALPTLSREAKETPDRPSSPPIKGAINDADWEVKFSDDDPDNPLNWKLNFRWLLTGAAGLLVLNATFASSAPSGVLPEMAKVFGMTADVSVLVLSLFVAGYVVGPLAFGPLSEQYGRKPPLVVAFTLYTLFQVGSALAPNVYAVLLFRLFGGMCASCPLVVTGGMLSDLFEPRIRGLAISVFVLAPTLGPALGPIIGGYMGDAGVKWSALYWLLCGFAGVCLVVVCCLPETYAPVILSKRAKRLRKETGDPWWAPLERKQTGLKARAHDVCVRPFAMLVQEPMLASATAYMSLIYGILYLSFVAYPIIFQEGHHFRAGPSGLMFLPFLIGAMSGTFVSIIHYNPKYIRDSDQYPPKKAPPELRLNSAYIGAPLLPVALLWLAFTSYPSIHWAVPMMSGVPLGYALSVIFLPLMNYIIDSYTSHSATALASATVVRSIAGAVFPLFGKKMYTALTARYAGLILALVCLLMTPLPFVFRRYGPAIRARSKTAVAARLQEEEEEREEAVRRAGEMGEKVGEKVE